VVANDQVKPILTIESMEQIENPFVCVLDCGKTPVLPQFIPIAYLNIGKSLLVIVLQGIQQESLVPGKDVCTPIVSTMAVGEKDEPRIIIEIHSLGCIQDPPKPLLSMGVFVLLYGLRNPFEHAANLVWISRYLRPGPTWQSHSSTVLTILGKSRVNLDGGHRANHTEKGPLQDASS